MTAGKHSLSWVYLHFKCTNSLKNEQASKQANKKGGRELKRHLVNRNYIMYKEIAVTAVGRRQRGRRSSSFPAGEVPAYLVDLLNIAETEELDKA